MMLYRQSPETMRKMLEADSGEDTDYDHHDEEIQKKSYGWKVYQHSFRVHKYLKILTNLSNSRTFFFILVG